MIRPKDRGEGVNASVGYGQVPTIRQKNIASNRYRNAMRVRRQVQRRSSR